MIHIDSIIAYSMIIVNNLAPSLIKFLSEIEEDKYKESLFMFCVPLTDSDSEPLNFLSSWKVNEKLLSEFFSYHHPSAEIESRFMCAYKNKLALGFKSKECTALLCINVDLPEPSGIVFPIILKINENEIKLEIIYDHPCLYKSIKVHENYPGSWVFGWR